MNVFSKLAVTVFGFPSILDVAVAAVCVLFIQDELIIVAVALVRVLFAVHVYPKSKVIERKFLEGCTAGVFLVVLYYFCTNDHGGLRHYVVIYMGGASAGVLLGVAGLVCYRKLFKV